MSRIKALQFYLLSRLLLAPLMLWTIATLVFLLLRATPGDPVDAILGNRAPEAVKIAMRETLGLNKNLLWQYLDYFQQLLRLDLGESLVSKGQSVTDIIQTYFPATAELTFYSLGFAFLLGSVIGMVAASRSGTCIDAGGRIFGIVSYALPIFWVGMILQLIFAVQLCWFPLGGRFPLDQAPPETWTGLLTVDSLLQGNVQQWSQAMYYLTLPSLTLGLLLSGIFERMVRINLQKTLKSDYVEAARARGIPESRILFSHALKNALIPVVTVLGLTIASLLGGAVLTEVTFSWPGLGNQLYEAISRRDYPLVQGLMIFFGTIVVVVSLLIDLVNAYIDPRIRY